MTPSPSISNLARLAANATKRPWQTGEQHETKCEIGAGPKSIATVKGEWCEPRIYNDARFIVSAANSHDALLRIAEAAQDRMNGIRMMASANNDAGIDVAKAILLHADEAMADALAAFAASAQGGREDAS